MAHLKALERLEVLVYWRVKAAQNFLCQVLPYAEAHVGEFFCKRSRSF